MMDTYSTIPTMQTAATRPALLSMTVAHCPRTESPSSIAACGVPLRLIRRAAGDEAVMAMGDTKLAFRL
jgi:hypothetical protein